MSTTKLDKSTIDYSVYLITDSALNHSSRTVPETVEAAILGGVRIVQVREKEINDEEFTQLAREVQAVTKKYNVPLIINDRIDVALAIDADGVHVGQTDTPALVARDRIGPDKILGVSVETVEHALQAIADGVDYIGIQTCFPTPTKTTAAIVQGHIGVRSILEAIPLDVSLKTVVIGGLNAGNVGRIVAKSKGQNGRGLDGVAVVSAIVRAEDARQASVKLLEIFKAVVAPACTGFDDLNLNQATTAMLRADEALKLIPNHLAQLREEAPLVYHITNYVSINDCANVTLAIGGSPIMAFAPEEVEDLVRAAGALVINIGTLTEDLIELAVAAGKHANALSKPIILDPVGAGATALRRRAVRRILNAVHVDVIKGNASEIAAVAEITGYEIGKEEIQAMAKGVDSVGAGFKNPEEIVRGLAAREHCVVVMSGKTDYVSDGRRTTRAENGHPLQGKITGSGCMLASVIASFSAAAAGLKDHFLAAVAGVVCTNLAGEHAAARPDVRGPGTFRAAFVDEMANLKPEAVQTLIEIKGQIGHHEK